MLIDDIKIKIKAGNGGKGAVAFNKNLMSLGPAGGRGGTGGNILFEGISNLDALHQFRFKKELKAENGKDGRGQFVDGQAGENLVLKVPIGTVIHNLTTGENFEITKVGEKIIAAKGGRGGKGNFHFRSPRNTSPKQSEPGKPGENFDLRLELKLIADIGLIGLPNAGKSSLINELTNASAKVANYPFTTLEPNLGVFYELILADIPGIIEGASNGKGLGIKFLRHIERTKILFHLISAESAKPSADYKAVRKELKAYNKDLLKKPEYIFLSKSDTLSKTELKNKFSKLKRLNSKTQPLSIYDWDSIEKVKKILNKISATKKFSK